MSNYLYSSNAVDSLIAYIKDVKPYHSKLSEIVEEYQFYENLNVTVDDSKHFIRTKIAGIWDNETYSNGLYRPFINLPFFKQAKSSKYWNNCLKIDESNLDAQIPSLNSAYYLKHNIGVRHVTKNGITQNEGIDFHISHGAYTISVDGEKQKYVESAFENVTGNDDMKWVKGFQLISENSSVNYQNVAGQNGSIIDIKVNDNAQSYEEWNVECIQSNANTIGTRLTYEHVQSVPSTLWNVQHRLDSNDLFFQTYISNIDGILTPISPNDVEIVDGNSINIRFTNPQIGKVKLLRFVESKFMFHSEILSPSTRWEINHNLNTRDLIFSILVDLDGTLQFINPSQIEFVDDNNISILFSSPKSGKLNIGTIGSYASATFVQDVPAQTWSFDNTLRTDSGIFLVYTDSGSIIFPQTVTINKNLIFVTFSSPQAGKLLFVKLFSAGSENTIFKVIGSETGLNGYAKVGQKFESSNISFLIIPNDEESTFTVGEKFTLLPDNKIVTRKDYVDQEKWSFIKINPIAHQKPKFTKFGSSIISDFVILDQAIREQVLSAVYDGEKFIITSSLDGEIGNVENGSTFSTTEYSFTISSGIINPINSDYFEIAITNLPPKISNLDLTVGYDIVNYDNTEYDDHFINFDLTSLNLSIVDQSIQTSYFELTFNGTTFDVAQYNNKIERAELAQFQTIQIGENYSNSLFSISIPSNVSYLSGDIIVFDVINPEPSVDPLDFSMISSRFGAINLYPKSFIDSPAQQWAISINEDSSFDVIGSVSGQQSSGIVSQSYDNGFIHFTLLNNTLVPFSAGDKFFVTINDEKPSYLVHGEFSGFSKPLTLGKWYWNGKIGLKLEKPKYHIHEFVSVGEGKQERLLETGQVVLDEIGNSINFIKPPRFDAKSDVYKMELLTNKYEDSQILKVESAQYGIQNGAKTNARYINEIRPEQSRLVGFSHHDGIVDLQINSQNDLPPNTTISFAIKSDDLKLYHANDLIIFTSPIESSIVNVERETTDKIYLQTSNKNPVLGVNPLIDEAQWFPTYTIPDQSFSDESSNIDVYASIINKKIGTIKNIGGINSQYQFVADDTFFSEFLPFNTKLSSKIIQNEQENAIVKARITETMRIFDFYRWSETVNVLVNEQYSIKIDSHSPIFNDIINVQIDDKTFRGFFAGYDTQPFDIEQYGYEDSASIQTETFSASAGGIGYLIQDKAPSSTSISKIGESLSIYSRLSAEAIGFADAYANDGLPPIDALGWDNAEVIDGLPPIDALGWDNAEFDIVYGYTEEGVSATPFELTVAISALQIPTSGSELSSTPYSTIPSALISVNRKVESIIIMKRGVNASTAIMYSDLSTLEQISIQIVENTADYLKIVSTTPSIGKIVIF